MVWVSMHGTPACPPFAPQIPTLAYTQSEVTQKYVIIVYIHNHKYMYFNENNYL